MKYTDDQIEALIKGIEDGSINESNLPVDYYESLAEYFTKALTEGFGSTLENVAYKSENTLKELLVNVNHFAAAKTYQQTVEMTNMLVDEEGNLRSSNEFNRLARELYDNWNVNYGRTEYATVLGSSDMAAKWQDIQANKDVVPNLKYSATGEACAICAPLDNLVAPVDDPIWDDVYPLNHFGCFCTVLQVDGDVSKIYESTAANVTENMSDSFKNNVGKSGEVFTKDHPYFDAPKKLRENNFGLPMPEEIVKTSEAATTLEQAKTNEKQWIDTLSTDDKETVSTYTGQAAFKWNEYLRTGFSKDVTEQTLENIDNMKRILKDAPKYEGTVFRALRFRETEFNNFVANIKEGELFVDKGFMSTSYRLDSALDGFGTTSGRGVLFEIKCKNGVLIESLSTARTEKEILLNAESKFIVESSEYTNNIQIIKLKEL